ncbi:MAG: aminoacyl-tRNA hydrolase [Planctomycetes bacterium]|nr:aminoacyl-tRNA hydrolase [Planctomycetota bacterium]
MRIRLGQSLVIDSQDIRFETARSSGPGGQNVNKVSTKVTLCFDLQGTRALDAGRKRILRRKLGTRISKRGILRVTSLKYRSQSANKKAALRRFEELLTEALKPTKKRIATRVRRSAVEKRIRQKKERGRVKQGRRRVAEDD